MNRHFSNKKVISHNELITPAFRPKIETDTHSTLHAGRWLTAIDQRYEEVYDNLLIPIMAGFVALAAIRNNTGPRLSHGASIFGFNNMTIHSTSGEYIGRIFVPNINRAFVPWGSNTTELLDTFHAELINRTNDALNVGESPYRLAPLALTEQPQLTDMTKPYRE